MLTGLGDIKPFNITEADHLMPANRHVLKVAEHATPETTLQALSIRANWLREAEPGSKAMVVGVDATGRTLIDVGGVSLVYGVEGLHRRIRQRSSTGPAGSSASYDQAASP